LLAPSERRGISRAFRWSYHWLIISTTVR
jgi:hypothetical protein